MIEVDEQSKKICKKLFNDLVEVNRGKITHVKMDQMIKTKRFTARQQFSDEAEEEESGLKLVEM